MQFLVHVSVSTHDPEFQNLLENFTLSFKNKLSNKFCFD